MKSEVELSGRISAEVQELKRYDVVLYLGFALWILETAYFGWNMTAQSGAERVLDLISGLMMGYGLICSFAQDIAIGVMQRAQYNVETLKIKEKCVHVPPVVPQTGTGTGSPVGGDTFTGAPRGGDTQCGGSNTPTPSAQ